MLSGNYFEKRLMDYKTKYPGLVHYNKDELLSLINYNEKNLEVLLNTYFEEFPRYIKKLRTSLQTENELSAKLFAGSIADSANAVRFEIMTQLANEIVHLIPGNKEKILDIIDEMEVENEYLRDLAFEH